MEKILLMNLKRLGDVYSTGHLIDSITQTNPHAEISILTYEESRAAAINLRKIKQVYTVDRKHIITLKVNKIFSDTMALEYFYESLKPLRQTTWDQVINVSNDRVSAYICSFLAKGKSTTKRIGMSFSESNSPAFSSDWDLVLNEIVASSDHSPFQAVDALRFMTGPNGSSATTSDIILFNEKHQRNAHKNISLLKEKMAHRAPTVVGFQLFASHIEKQIPHTVIEATCKSLIDSGLATPLLLIGPFEHERVAAQEMNRHLGNRLVVAEADLSAVASVIKELDFIVTPDTVTKHIADLVATPCLEVSLGEAPLFKQGSRNPQSLVLSPTLRYRQFSNEKNNFTHPEISNQLEVISPEDLVNCITYALQNNPESLSPKLSDLVTLYQPHLDELGVNLVAVAGDLCADSEAARHFSRHIVGLSLNNSKTEYLVSLVASTLNKDTPRWSAEQKQVVTNVTKDLLGTLRSLIQAQESQKKVHDFIVNLDRLMSYADDNNSVASLLKLFRGKVEALSAGSFQENVRELEGLLYELKADLQKYLLAVKDLETAWHEQKKAFITQNRITKQVQPNIV